MLWLIRLTHNSTAVIPAYLNELFQQQKDASLKNETFPAGFEPATWCPRLYTRVNRMLDVEVANYRVILIDHKLTRKRKLYLRAIIYTQALVSSSTFSW